MLIVKSRPLKLITVSLPAVEFLGSIVVSIPACHAGDRGSIPRRGDRLFYLVNAHAQTRYRFQYKKGTKDVNKRLLLTL